MKELLPAHALSGCDTVACYFGVGKGSVVNGLKAGYELSTIGNINVSFTDVIEQVTAFISACYGMKETKDISETRLHVCRKTNREGPSSAPHLCSLPPTREAFTNKCEEDSQSSNSVANP